MDNRGKIGLASLAVIVVITAAWVWWDRRSQPQLPASDEAFKAVDGLFTAVTARDAALLTACQQRLAAIHAAGQLPGAAWRRLQTVISMSERGHWEAAARQLYDLIQGQRRQGSESSELTAMAR